MYRQYMAPDEGMLFLMGETKEQTFWMRNTLIPLDMLFADREGVVRHIQERAVPLSEAIISSEEPVRAVVELNGGTVGRLGLKVGDRLVHPMFR